MYKSVVSKMGKVNLVKEIIESVFQNLKGVLCLRKSLQNKNFVYFKGKK